MSAWRANAQVSVLVSTAMGNGPRDPLTIAAYGAQTGLRFILMIPTLILTPISTLVLGLAATITFGVPLYLLSIPWLVLLGILLGTRWTWLNFPIVRPLLFIPGVIVTAVAYTYVSLVPAMGEKYQKALKLALCDSWPYSFTVFRLSRLSPFID